MAKIKLTKSDFSLLWHALDILMSDYEDREKVLVKIERLKLKLVKIEKGISK